MPAESKLDQDRLNHKDSIFREPMLDAFDEIIFVISNNFEIEEINAKGCEVLGMPREKIIGKSCKQLFSCRSYDECPIHQSIATGQTRNIAHPIFFKNHYYKIKSSPNLDDRGKTVKIVEIRTDVTEYVRIEHALMEKNQEIAAQNEELRVINEEFQVQNEQLRDTQHNLEESEERYTSMFRYMKSGVAIYEVVDDGKDFILKDINQAAETITRISATEARNKRLLDLFPNMDQTALYKTLQQVHITGEPVKIPPFYYQDSVRAGWRENFIYKLPNGELVAIFDDITELKTSEEKLKRSEERYRFLSNLTSEGIVLHKDGLVIDLNKSFGKLTGYTYDELIGQAWVDLIVPKKKDRKLIAEKIRDSELEPYQITVIRKDGVTIIAEVSGCNIIFNGEKFRMSSLRDVTERARAARILEEKKLKLRIQNEKYLLLNEELHASNAKIHEINQVLIKANRELDNFVYSVSHDLRAPITSTLGLSRLIRQTSSLEEIFKYAELQDKSLVKLDNFIREILDYSRNSRLTVTPEIVDFKELVTSVIEELRFINNSIKVNFYSDFDCDDQFKSDLLRLKIILNNLISNAIRFQNKYQEHPFVKIVIQADAKRAVIDISDNGIGIEKKHFEKIFEMFYRATDQTQGSGIGLYITKDCVDKLQGKIEFDSEYGLWTRFKVSLPSL